MDLCIACLETDCWCAFCGAQCCEDCTGSEHDRTSKREVEAFRARYNRLPPVTSQDDPSIVDWAESAGWEHLSDALRRGES
jgi:hypothetical protein